MLFKIWPIYTIQDLDFLCQTHMFLLCLTGLDMYLTLIVSRGDYLPGLWDLYELLHL